MFASLIGMLVSMLTPLLGKEFLEKLMIIVAEKLAKEWGGVASQEVVDAVAKAWGIDPSKPII